jgi:hypothetical protein
MATLKTFFRANTDTISTLVQSNGSVDVGTPFFTKTIRVSLGVQLSPITRITTNILAGATLDALITSTGSAYINISVVGRGAANDATDGAIIQVKNLSTLAVAANNTVTNVLTNLGDTLILPWRVDIGGDTDIDACPTIDANLTVAAATGKYVDLYVAVYTNA